MHNPLKLAAICEAAPDRQKLADLIGTKPSYVMNQLSMLRRIASGKLQCGLTPREIQMCAWISTLYPNMRKPQRVYPSHDAYEVVRAYMAGIGGKAYTGKASNGSD